MENFKPSISPQLLHLLLHTYYSEVFPTLQGLHKPIAFIMSSIVIVNDEKLKPTITLYMLQYIRDEIKVQHNHFSVNLIHVIFGKSLYPERLIINK